MPHIGQVVWVDEYKQGKRYKRGDKFVYPKPKLVSTRLAVIIDGQYMSNGRISNFWSWTYMDEATGQAQEKAHGNDNGAPYLLRPAPQYKAVTSVVKTTETEEA